MPPALLTSLLMYTQRDYTFSTKKAEKDFGYKPLFNVRAAIDVYMRRRTEKKRFDC